MASQLNFIIFWHEIGRIVYQTYKDAFKKGTLIGSQNQGVIHLIPPKDKKIDCIELMAFSLPFKYRL